MADNARAPAADVSSGEVASENDGSIDDAAQAFLGLLDPEQPDTQETTEAELSEDESIDESDEEAEPELEAQAEEEDSEEAEPEEEVEEDSEPELYAVTVNGETQMKTLDELRAGYSRTDSFTQKSQALAEQRRQFEENAQQISQEQAAIQQERQQMYAVYEQMLHASAGELQKFQNIDMERLRVEDPVEWSVKNQELQMAQQKIAQTQQQQAMVAQRHQAEQQKAYQKMVETERAALAEKIPEYGDPAKAQELGSQLASYARSQGWNDQEIDGLVEHRHFISLRKAMLYDKLKAADVKSKKVKGKPKVARPGKGIDKGEVTKKQRNDSINRLKRTGGIKEAASAFEALLS